MPRNRMLRPGLWDSQALSGVCREARLLFIGLISLGDDDGRLTGNTAWLKSKLFPFDEDISSQEIDTWLKELLDADPMDPMLLSYEVDGKTYLAHTKWHTHQKLNRPTPSSIPECPPDQLPDQVRIELPPMQRRKK
tara:strand:+ start:666 stop:1073 length:408 start_codon:yes stop_codon:yes gene_type:complete